MRLLLLFSLLVLAFSVTTTPEAANFSQPRVASLNSGRKAVFFFKRSPVFSKENFFPIVDRHI